VRDCSGRTCKYLEAVQQVRTADVSIVRLTSALVQVAATEEIYRKIFPGILLSCILLIFLL
jgi:hypothetical protein